MLIAALALALADATPATFDLVCDVTQVTVYNGKQGKQNNFQTHYRVDLARSLWCGDRCENVDKLAQVTDTNIVLIEQDKAPFKTRMEVNRVSGVFSGDMAYHTTKIDSDTVMGGVCHRAPYSGIPERQF